MFNNTLQFDDIKIINSNEFIFARFWKKISCVRMKIINLQLRKVFEILELRDIRRSIQDSFFTRHRDED